jgi:DNA invertase Pin-like site-specific DNA recombinase
MATYGYIRVSTAEQAEGSSLEDQKLRIEDQKRRIGGLAVAADLTLDHCFQDVDVSGSVPLADRPEGSRLCAALKAGDSIVVAKLDRLFRSAADALAMAETFKNRGVNLHILDMGTEPVTANGASRMFFGMLALVAEFERSRIKERVADGRQGKAAKGGHIGGTAPFGYRVEGAGKAAILVPVPAEQEALETIRKARNEGLSLRRIADLVHERHGLSISHVAVQRVLAADKGKVAA